MELAFSALLFRYKILISLELNLGHGGSGSCQQTCVKDNQKKKKKAITWAP